MVKLRVDMEDRGGRLELLLPYATLEPIRKLLLQQFMGEKFGRDNIWESHLAGELWNTSLKVEAVLDELQVPLRRALEMKVGDTWLLDAPVDGPVQLKCGAVALTKGRMGRIGHKMAVRVDSPVAGDARRAMAKLGGER
jgi:flagellar motor switch protein FliM